MHRAVVDEPVEVIGAKQDDALISSTKTPARGVVSGWEQTGFSQPARRVRASLAYAAVTPSEIVIVRQPLTRRELAEMAQARFGDMVKAVVDVARDVMAINGELHSDEEALLLEDGSRQADIWGINLYPNESGPEWIEFDSMINVRPSQNNRSRDVEDERTRAEIRRVVAALVTDS